jgi:hypothetical protein
LLTRARNKNKEFEDVLNSALTHNRKLIEAKKIEIKKIKQKEKYRYDLKIREAMYLLKKNDHFDSQVLEFPPSRIIPDSDESINGNHFGLEDQSEYTNNIQNLIKELECSGTKKKNNNDQKNDKPSQAKKIA